MVKVYTDGKLCVCVCVCVCVCACVRVRACVRERERGVYVKCMCERCFYFFLLEQFSCHTLTRKLVSGKFDACFCNLCRTFYYLFFGRS